MVFQRTDSRQRAVQSITVSHHDMQMKRRKRMKKYLIKTIYERMWTSKISNCNKILIDFFSFFLHLFVILMQILKSIECNPFKLCSSSLWFDLTIFKWESLCVTQWTEQTISMILIWSILQDEELRLIEFYGPISWCDSWQSSEEKKKTTNRISWVREYRFRILKKKKRRKT